MDFLERIKGFKYILRTYEDALSASLKVGVKRGQDTDLFLSKNCRAYFFEHHLKVEREASDQEVRDINKPAIVPYELSFIQLRELDDFERMMSTGRKFRMRRMKCRRARVSTIYLAIGYHMIRFFENKKGLCFADRLETSRKLRRILDIFYQSDDLVGKPTIGRKTLCEGLYLHPYNLPEKSTDKDSFILLGSGEQSNSGIGGSLDFMIWSEASLTPDAESHWTTISPSLQGALFDVAESTPSLTGQDAIIFPEFKSTSENCDFRFIPWMDVKEYRIDDEVKVKNFVPFDDHNLYGKEVSIIEEFKTTPQQMLWRRFKLDEIKNLNAFKQVFPISTKEAFYSSAGLFFNEALINMTIGPKVRASSSHSFADQGVDISAMPDDNGAWKIYLPRELGMKYVVIVDTAEGKTSDREGRDPDYSVSIVFKLSFPLEEVAILRDRIPPEVMAEQVAVAARYYNNALIVPERNGPGLALLVRLLQIYSNIYRSQKLQGGTFVMTQEYGFQTTTPSKVYALSKLQSIIRDKDKGLILHTQLIRDEMSKFVQTGTKYGAMGGYHDDTIACLWLLAVCVDQTPSLLESSQNYDGQPQRDVGFIQPPIPRDNWAYQ